MPSIVLPDPPLSDGVVALRAPTEADAPAVCDYCQDPEVVRWTVVPSPYGIEDARTWIAWAATSPAAGFTEEGLLRSYRERKGRREDRVVFSPVRADLGAPTT